jgi:hypothetical protein
VPPFKVVIQELINVEHRSCYFAVLLGPELITARQQTLRTPTATSYILDFPVAVGTLERGNALLQGLDFACGSAKPCRDESKRFDEVHVKQEGWQLRPAIQGGHKELVLVQVRSLPT